VRYSRRVCSCLGLASQGIRRGPSSLASGLVGGISRTTPCPAFFADDLGFAFLFTCDFCRRLAMMPTCGGRKSSGFLWQLQVYIKVSRHGSNPSLQLASGSYGAWGSSFVLRNRNLTLYTGLTFGNVLG
jgi:hypothetical protein